MLVKINSHAYVCASKVISIRKLTSGSRSGEWVASVQEEFGVKAYEVSGEDVNILIREINEALKK